MIHPDQQIIAFEASSAKEYPRIAMISDPALYRDKEVVYLAVRRKENRLYDDELVQRLPLIKKDDPYYAEWGVRMISALRLHKYLLDDHRTLRILDIGCGNGWLSNLMTQVFESRVYGIDVNMYELNQAVRVFGKNANLTFAYCDILRNPFPTGNFDVIILAATIQYFPDLRLLIQQLQKYLAPGGAIHILDSPFYALGELETAKAKTSAYYHSLGLPAMSRYYFHHTLEELKDFNYREIYDPVTFMNKVRRKILSSADSPFTWISISKTLK